MHGFNIGHFFVREFVGIELPFNSTAREVKRDHIRVIRQRRISKINVLPLSEAFLAKCLLPLFRTIGDTDLFFIVVQDSRIVVRHEHPTRRVFVRPFDVLDLRFYHCIPLGLKFLPAPDNFLMDVRWVCGNDFGSKGTGLRVVGLEVAVNDVINDACQLLVIPFGQFDNGPLNPFRRFLDAGGTVVPRIACRKVNGLISKVGRECHLTIHLGRYFKVGVRILDVLQFISRVSRFLAQIIEELFATFFLEQHLRIHIDLFHAGILHGLLDGFLVKLRVLLKQIICFNIFF